MNTPHQQKKTEPPRAPRRLLLILLLVGLVAVIASFFLTQTPASSLAQRVTPSPFSTFTPRPPTIPMTPRVPPTPVTIAAPTIITAGKKPPVCRFPLPQTITKESAAENYTFSDPKSVPLNPSWRVFYFYQWLPDNQRVLIAHSDEAQWNNTEETIGALNPQTGESRDFGSRQTSDGHPPVWIPSLNAVVYPEHIDLTSYTFSPNGGAIIPPVVDFQRRLWLSRGDPTPRQKIVEDRVTINFKGPSKVGSQFTLAANAEGTEIAYLDSAGAQIYRQRVVQGSLQAVPSPAFDATQWMYRQPVGTGFGIGWYMAWRPNSTQVFLYSQSDGFGFSYTFLLDVQSGAVCQLNLWTEDPIFWKQSWAGQAHWSPNGRYLAVVRAKGHPLIDTSDLIVLDTANGKLYRFDATKFSPAGLEKQGNHFVTDVAWAPDSRHLAGIGRVDYWTPSSPEMQDANRLFLLDFITGQSVQASSAELSGLRWPNGDLFWSSDGSKLIVSGAHGLLLLSVQKRVQP